MQIAGLKPKWRGSVVFAIGFAVAGAAALIITSLMNRKAGVAQGATADGQELLGWGAITVHVAGLLVFGGLTGRLYANGEWIKGSLTGLVMLATAAFSIWSIMDFVATERTSIARARDAQEKAIRDEAAAKREAAKEVRDTQAKLAQDAAKWAQGTIRQAEGRRERKDAYEAVSKIITAVGQGGQSATPTPDKSAPNVILQQDAGAEMIADATGYSVSRVQTARMAYLAIMLIVIEVFAWPLMTFCWPRPVAAAGIIGAAPITITPSAPSPSPPAPALAAKAALALPSPAEERAGVPPPALASHTSGPAAVPGRVQGHWQLLPGAEDSLRSAGFPIDGKMAGRPLRPKLKGKDLGLKFVSWMQAGALHGEHRWGDDDIERLNEEFSRAYHCDVASHRHLKEAIDSLVPNKLAYKSRPVQQDGSRPVRWSINAGRYPKPPKHENEPAKEGRRNIIPFSEASERDLSWAPLAQHLAMKTRHMDRIKRAACHKQRGSRIHRRAA